MPFKFITYSIMGIISLCVFGYIALDIAFSDLYSNEVKKDTIVIKTYAPQAPTSLSAYTGPFPASFKRTQDPFQYPIQLGEVGPHEPVFSGPLQYPFLCGTERSHLGQPLVDNQDGHGMPVYAVDPNTNEKTKQLMGYSKDCLLPTQADYYYHSKTTEDFQLLTPEIEADGTDISQITFNGSIIDFIVRVEMGTINRFLYTIINLRSPNGTLEKPDTTYWNKTLIYQFRGGVGIGKRQGVLDPKRTLNRRKDVLEKGYAVAFSTGNQTSNHYNIWLAEEVMMRVKNQFISLFGEPRHTIGIGGSGGAIQQLLIAQNHPGLLDGALALYAYADMVSQIPYAYDCELLEYYFDVTNRDNPKWHDWSNRTWIQGLNAEPGHTNEYTSYYNLARLINGAKPIFAKGMTECSHAWRGLTQLTNNPKFTHLAKYYSASVLAGSHWTHWDDLKHLYGTRPSGYANQAWDNVGVQYGLEALKENTITVEEFLHINHSIGGWRPPEAMQQERLWQLTPHTSLFEFSPWSHHNQWTSHDPDQPAIRTRGDEPAIHASYTSGHVFLGKIDIPIIDLRHYLEKELDMHHLSASIGIRQRILDFAGDAEHHTMWVTEKPHTPIIDAIEALTQWVDNRKTYSSLQASRPPTVQDTCFNAEGDIIAQGQQVWDGPWNQKEIGNCSLEYPMYRTSRIVAGDDWRGDTLKCQLQSVEQAIETGVYGQHLMTQHQAQLERIFPDGVCDYTATAKVKMQYVQQLQQQLGQQTTEPIN